MPKRLTKKERSAFLDGRRVGVLGTIGEDGTPLLTPIWYLRRGAKLLDADSARQRQGEEHPA